VKPRQRLVLVIVAGLLCLGSLPAPDAHAWNASSLACVSQDDDWFFTYDFESTLAASTNCDWPVTIVFWGHATVAKVKAALSPSLPIYGNPEYARLRDQPVRRRGFIWVTDRGVKAFNLTKALHMRLYADADGRLSNVTLGDYVIATTHYDLNELSSDPTFGMSEEAAAAIEALCVKAYGAEAVAADVLPLGNVEPDRVEQRANDKGGLESHHWQCDGLATLVYVP
jgi:hypothetical protein